jgi:two-component system, NarL family, nitrate/nitrite response regulator NarL
MANFGDSFAALAASPQKRINFIVVNLEFDDRRHDDVLRLRQLAGKDLRIVLVAERAEFHKITYGQILLVDGVLNLNASSAETRESLRLIQAGERVVPSSLVQMLLGSATVGLSGQQALPTGLRLTAREVDILRQLVRGGSNKVIAHELGISEATVKVHLKSLLRKLRVANRTQAAIWAQANGFADR